MTIEILPKEAASILTPQRNGFLTASPHPFTHTLSGYVGCGFGETTCGLYCYAQFLPNWQFRHFPATWGQAVQVKTNAAQLLEKTLGAMKSAVRKGLRIFMSSSTDPYQPAERQYQITRQCLEVFARYDDLDLLVVQTRSPLAVRDFPLLKQIPYVWLSVTIETDDQAFLKHLKGGPLLEKRWVWVRSAHTSCLHTHITVSPCLPFTGVEIFSQRLLNSGAERIIIDTVVDGDGSGGKRTARSPFAKVSPDWNKTSHAHQLYSYLKENVVGTDLWVGWSTEGFCSIEPRT